jgi:O-antigen ligase
VALSLAAGFVVFQSFVASVDRTHLLLTCAVVTALAGLVTQRPSAATYLGFVAAVLAISYDPQVVRRSGLVLLALGLVVGWRAAEQRRRQVTLLLLALLGVSLLTGALIDPPAVFKEGTALALSYAVLQGANAALHHFPTRHLQLLLMAWGCAASVPMLVHPPGTEARFGSLAFGENANTLGFLAALGAVAAVSWAWDPDGASWWWTIPVMALCGYGVVLSGSRAALLCVACSAAVLVLRPWLRDSPLKVAMVSLGGLAAVLLIGPLVTGRFLAAASRDMSVTHGLGLRGQIAEFALDETWHHPLTGIGLGRLSELTVDDPRLGIEISAHNTYLGLLAACGLVAGGLLLALVVIALVRTRLASTTALLPLAVTVVISGVAMEWYGTNTIGPLCFSVLAMSAACAAPRPLVQPEPGSEKTNWLQPSPPPHVNILSSMKPRSR